MSDQSSEYTDRHNKWLNTAPAGADAFQDSSGGLGIDCEPDGIKVFGGQAQDEASDFAKSSQDGVTALTMAASRIGGSFREAAYFGEQHGWGLQALGMFSGDAFKGLSALGMGATAIGVTYRNCDATSAATVKDVEKAFSGNGFDLGSGSQRSAHGSSSGGHHGHGKGLLPDAKPLTDAQKQDLAADPNDRSVDQTIDLGDRDTYTVPAAGPNDLELRDPQNDINATLKKQATTG